MAHIEKKIGKERMSPYAALQSIENDGKEFSVRICLRTLYHYIERGLFLNIGKGDLPQGGKQRRRSYEKVRRANNNPTGASISERAEEIESRNDFGHWELDTVVGKARTKAALLVLTERKTRYELVYKLENKTQDAVITALNRLERKLGFESSVNLWGNQTFDYFRFATASFESSAVHILPSGDENAIYWFLEDKTDTRSSNYLEGAATEIQVQGLELDYTWLLWDADMRYENGEWHYYRFNGYSKWNELTGNTENKQDQMKYMLNAYRVLLTRARAGMVICVPAGIQIKPHRLLGG